MYAMPSGRHPAALPESTIDRRGVAIAKVLDHHVQGHAI